MVKKFRIRPDLDPHSSAARIWNTTFDILFFFFALLVKYYLRNFSWLRIIVGFFSRFFYRHNSTLNMYSTTIYIPWTKSWWKFLETINAFVFLSFCIRRAELLFHCMTCLQTRPPVLSHYEKVRCLYFLQFSACSDGRTCPRWRAG